MTSTTACCMSGYNSNNGAVYRNPSQVFYQQNNVMQTNQPYQNLNRGSNYSGSFPQQNAYQQGATAIQHESAQSPAADGQVRKESVIRSKTGTKFNTLFRLCGPQMSGNTRSLNSGQSMQPGGLMGQRQMVESHQIISAGVSSRSVIR